ncbi:MAG: FkbM family methyltransferase [Bacteroidota bacterium]|jgi:FkbM family methyltransferase
MGLITNILQGILKNLKGHALDTRFAPISWVMGKIIKHEDDTTLKLRNLGPISVLYKRPYELLKTYSEIFVCEIYRFDATHTNPVIIDCGANIGISSLYFKSIYPAATLIAFEPDQSLADIFEKNMAQNSMINYTLHRAAVWTENGTISFDNKGSEASSIDVTGNSSFQVPTIKLATILAEQTQIDLLKIDIEGAEYPVVQDIANELHKVQHLFIEYHGLANETYKLETILHIVSNAGFKTYIKMAADNLDMPFYQKQTGTIYDVQLNIFCYR